MRRLLLSLVFSLPVLAVAQSVHISPGGMGNSHKSLKVPLNGVVRVKLATGQTALIQFTSISEGAAEYRWKYRPAPGGEVNSGNGRVEEKYQRLPTGDAHSPLVDPLPGHDVIVRAGGITAEWSVGGEKYCYFYYDSSLARVEVLNATAFEKQP